MLGATAQQNLKKNLAKFDEVEPVRIVEVLRQTPKVYHAPKIVSLNHYNVTIELSFWEPARVFGVVRPLNASAPRPFSTQIYQGKNQNNFALGGYRSAKNSSRFLEPITLTFDDLRDNTEYEIFLTVASTLPYSDPPMLYEDNEVLSLQFKTPPNPSNLIFSSASEKAKKKLTPKKLKKIFIPPSLSKRPPVQRDRYLETDE